MKFPSFKPFVFAAIALLFIGTIGFRHIDTPGDDTPTSVAFQSIKNDGSLTGVGTDTRPLGADFKKYRAILSQASTSAPTAVVIDNELSGAGAYTYTGVGHYTWELDDAFTANETFVNFTIGNATGLVPHAYSITDSTVVLKVFDAAGAAVNLAGTAYLEVTTKKSEPTDD